MGTISRAVVMENRVHVSDPRGTGVAPQDSRHKEEYRKQRENKNISVYQRKLRKCSKVMPFIQIGFYVPGYKPSVSQVEALLVLRPETKHRRKQS
jgi:hypothetical protein